jgi:beta-aspartyl-peptidase (threonine type)
VVLAPRVSARFERAGPVAATREALEQVPALGGAGADGGGIAIRADGRIGWWHNSPAFVVGIATSEAEAPRVYLNKDEEEEHG